MTHSAVDKMEHKVYMVGRFMEAPEQDFPLIDAAGSAAVAPSGKSATLPDNAVTLAEGSGHKDDNGASQQAGTRSLDKDNREQIPSHPYVNEARQTRALFAEGKDVTETRRQRLPAEEVDLLTWLQMSSLVTLVLRALGTVLNPLVVLMIRPVAHIANYLLKVIATKARRHPRKTRRRPIWSKLQVASRSARAQRAMRKLRAASV